MDKHQSTTETSFVGRDGHVFPRESLMHVVAGVRHLLTWLICVCWRLWGIDADQDARCSTGWI